MAETIIIFFSSKVHIIIAVIAVIYFLFSPYATKLKLVLLGAITMPLSYVVGKLSGLVIETTRPFIQMGVSPLVEHMSDNGFPSEHTLYALIIAGVVFCVNKKLGVFLAILGILVGVGRVFALVHSPIDIVGSVIIAFVIIILVCRSSYLRYMETMVKRISKYYNHT